ncbi:uncharacterized protein LOC142345642 isoform X3 [Convolutriloba macropyga]|uniref:uncharacterized protein LOC142345642 isoform X3 n=1 Tax=Convolutriloba macropyga TaxID=536237 RepID=UPI003F51F6F3
MGQSLTTYRKNIVAALQFSIFILLIRSFMRSIFVFFRFRMTVVIDSSFADKAEMCPLFESELYCPEEHECLYVHGLRELRSAENPLYISQKLRFKIEMGTNFEREIMGRMEDHYLFAQREHERRDLTTVSPIVDSQRQSDEPIELVQSSVPTNDRYKTKTCNFYLKYGNCTKGDSCMFAHVKPEGVNALSQESQSGGFISLLQQPTSFVPESSQEQRNTAPDPAKFKTRMCIPFQKQRCMKKDKCNFAHDESELKVHPKASTGTVKDVKQSGIYKTELCKSFEKNGQCFLDEDCMFAHTRYELRPKGFKGDFEEKIKTNPNWKCTLCDIFQKNGSCQRTDCNFAHGLTELRCSKRPEKPDKQSSSYKRALCKAFSSSGFCRNGKLCSFAHGEVELRGQNNGAMNATNMMQFASSLTDQQIGQQSSDQLMNTRKRGAEFGALGQMISALMPDTSGNEMADDMKVFAEFLQFKKFKKASEQMMAQASDK